MPAAQSILWKNLNGVLAKHGVPKSKFKGFMAYNTQANWNIVKVITVVVMPQFE